MYNDTTIILCVYTHNQCQVEQKMNLSIRSESRPLCTNVHK